MTVKYLLFHNKFLSVLLLILRVPVFAFIINAISNILHHLALMLMTCIPLIVAAIVSIAFMMLRIEK